MTEQSFQYDTTLKLGQNRGKPRIWIEGKMLAKAGFLPGTKFEVRLADGEIVLLVNPGCPGFPGALPSIPAGDRTVSGKQRESGPHPIIDMNTQEIAKVFPNVERIAVHMEPNKIVITPSRVATQIATRVATSVAVGLFVGMGLLSHAAKAAGFDTKVSVEWNADYAEVHAANHGGHTINQCISEARLHEAKERLGPVGLFHAGIPCEPYSVIRRNDGTNTKVDKKLPPEAHELGDMTFWALRAIDIFNPHTVVIEEVPAWLDSASGYIAQHVLRRLGYRAVEGRVFNSADYGAVTARRRAVLVATMHDRVAWPEPNPRQLRTLTEVLLPPDDPRCEWFSEANPGTKGWLFDHWAKQTAKGNGFASQLIHHTDATVGTIKKRYLAGQGDNQVVVHPLDSTQYRWLTLGEIKRIMGLPDDYYLGDAKTTAGEGLGQGVEVTFFTQLIRSVTGRAKIQQIAA